MLGVEMEKPLALSETRGVGSATSILETETSITQTKWSIAHTNS
jgi:hypothetical protein